MANIGACKDNLPAAISFPHFLHADDSYVTTITGLAPNHSKHNFFLDIVPTLGVAVNVHVAMQINVYLERDPEANILRNMTTDIIYFPMIYFIATATVDDRDTLQQLIRVQSFSAIVIGVSMAMILIGFVMITGCGVLIRSRWLDDKKRLKAPSVAP